MKKIIIGGFSLVLLAIIGIEGNILYKKGEIQGCKAVIMRRLEEAGRADILKYPGFEDTLNAFCAAVIKSR